ncbi:MAG: M48 family metalloprotease [Bacteroidetes bacterium]|nr:M48 family metalloprotease [Bacteroidota bacterium]
MTQRLITLALLLSGLSLFSQKQHLLENFEPLTSSGNLPLICTSDYKQIVATAISDAKKANKTSRPAATLESFSDLQKIIRSGNLLVDDEVSVYINQVADQVLKNDPELRQSLHFYVYQSPYVNVYTFKQGYIFINTGLIAQMENEAQLAFLICHEIGHYTRKHVPTQFFEIFHINDESIYYNKNKEEYMMDRCMFSGEQEASADSLGLQLYAKTPYAFTEPAKAIDILRYAQLPFDLVEFRKSFLEGPNYSIPAAYFLKEVAPIKSRHNDAEPALHPNTNARKRIIQDYSDKLKGAGVAKFMLPETTFDYIRDLSRFDLCRTALKDRDYPNALYNAYILSQKFPNNKFLAETVASSLYGIALYKNGKLTYAEHSFLGNAGIVGCDDVESFPQQVYSLIGKMPGNEWTILALNYNYRQLKKFPNSEAIKLRTDSLFKMMRYTDWGIVDFVRTDKPVENQSTLQSGSSKTALIASIQLEKDKKHRDTIYYKDIYLDLFMNDPVFSKKFPRAWETPVETVSPKPTKPLAKTYPKIDTLIVLAPFYYSIDQQESNEILRSKFMPEEKSPGELIRNAAASIKMPVVTVLDPFLFSQKDIALYNDYTFLKGWLNERNDDVFKSLNPTMVNDTSAIRALMERYNTRYMMYSGFISLNSQLRKGVISVVMIYDLKTAEIVYKKVDVGPLKENEIMMQYRYIALLNAIKYNKLSVY